MARLAIIALALTLSACGSYRIMHMVDGPTSHFHLRAGCAFDKRHFVHCGEDS